MERFWQSRGLNCEGNLHDLYKSCKIAVSVTLVFPKTLL
ncbi:hypothetical protein CKA32_004893 [Geitlerinema sp. FC II]|nr:hypothetical protein CKA32_004893 [Geitlerinema sp. FC II]